MSLLLMLFRLGLVDMKFLRLFIPQTVFLSP